MKRILVTALSVLLVAGMAISGTVAYLTDRDGAKNTMTTGLVEIQQYEQDRYGNDFVQNQIILPITGSAQQNKDIKGYPAEGMNYVDKLVTVKNTGNTDAYVRTLIAVPNYRYEGQAEDDASNNVLHWNLYQEKMAPTEGLTYKGKNNYRLDSQRLPAPYTSSDTLVLNNWKLDEASYEISVNGRNYEVYIINHNTALAAGERTAPNMQGFYLDSKVDYDHDKGVYTYNGKAIDGLTGYVDILVLSQAVQAGGFDSAIEAFEAAMPLGDNASETLAKWFNDTLNPNAVIGGNDKLNDLRGATSTGGNIVLTENLTLDDTQLEVGLYGRNDSAFKQDGGTIDGNGTTISVPRGNCGVSTKNGTIKNLTIDQAGYAIASYDPTDDIIIENVTICDNVGYCFNIQSEKTAPSQSNCSLIVKNSTLKGWISYGIIEGASFENCTFGHSDYWAGRYADYYGHHFKPYCTTTLTNCSFSAGYSLDLSALANGCTVTFKNCRVGGVLITDENIGSVFGRFELPSGKTAADIVTVTNT